MEKIYLFLFLFVFFVSLNTKGERFLTYGPTPPNNSYFGQWIVHESGWDRYVMFFSINSLIKNNYPGNVPPGDPGTYNDTLNTWWGDRIWMSWHFGDGKELSGWNQDDGSGNITPWLMVPFGGTNESGLVGDPTVTLWKGKWHMYYEGTDHWMGLSNRIFHATADNIFGPWTKQGEVSGLHGSMGGAAISWPTLLIENDELYMYYMDGNMHFLVAKATNDSGQAFINMNYDPSKPFSYTNPRAITTEFIDRGQVVKIDDGYMAIFDNYGRTQIRISYSTNKFDFQDSSWPILKTVPGSNWEQFRVGLPSYNKEGDEERIYYTGENAADGTNADVWGLGVLATKYSLKKPTTNLFEFQTRAWTDNEDSLISTAKIYTHKINLNSPEATIINDVNFPSISSGTISGTNWALSIENPGTFGWSYDFNPNHLCGTSSNLVRGFCYDSSLGSNKVTLTLTDLNPGEKYQLNIYSRGYESSGRWAELSGIDGAKLTIDQDDFGTGNGLLTSYRYLAEPDGTFTISITPVPLLWGWFAFANSSTEIVPPTTISASQGLYSDVIAINWSGYSGARYKLYKSTNSNWNTAEPISGVITNTYFFDFNVEPGEYYYWATSVIVPDESVQSPTATGWLLPEPVLFIHCCLLFSILLRKK